MRPARRWSVSSRLPPVSSRARCSSLVLRSRGVDPGSMCTCLETEKKRIKSIKLYWSWGGGGGGLNLTLQSHFIGELFETCHFVSDPLTTDQLDERICDDIQCREKAKDCTGGRQFRRESYAKIVPCLSLSIELCIYIYVGIRRFVSQLN